MLRPALIPKLAHVSESPNLTDTCLLLLPLRKKFTWLGIVVPAVSPKSAAVANEVVQAKGPCLFKFPCQRPARLSFVCEVALACSNCCTVLHINTSVF